MPRVSRKKRSTQYVHKTEAEQQQGEAGGSSLPRSMWSGTLSFGLVTVPVELYSATRSTRKSLRMLAPDGTPLSRRYFSEDGKPLDSEQLTRGYPLDDGSFVVVEDEELERLLPDQSRDIDLTRFVPRNSIPPLYYDRAYILAPAEGSSSAYRLLASTMERLDKAGIATFVMRDRQYIVAITARDGLLRAETLRFSDELRTPEDVGLPKPVEVSEARVREMRAAIKQLTKSDVAQRELSDSYWQRVEKLAEQKKAHNEGVVPADKGARAEDESVAEVIDLMAVLRQSLAQQKAPSEKKDEGASHKPARKAASKKPSVKKARTTQGAAKTKTKRAS